MELFLNYKLNLVIMKKLIFLIVMLLASVTLFAQDPEVPADVNDLLGNLSGFLGSLAGMAGVVIFITAILVNAFKVGKRWGKLVLGWIVAILLAVLSNVINFGLYAESTWLETLTWGAGLGFVAGSIFDIPTTKTLVNLLLSLIKLKERD